MTSPNPTVPESFDLARFNMIEQQIRPWEVLDPRVLGALAQVPRERYAPEGLQALAFADMELPLRPGASPGCVMLAPKIEARMLQDLDLKPTDRVLEIGTGSGHMAALLAKLAQHVLSLEIDGELARSARARLQENGVGNVQVLHADACAQGFVACSYDGPFDAILLSGSVAEVPHDLLDCLAEGGRLCAIVGEAPVMRATLIQRTGPGAFDTTQAWDTVAPRLLNFPQASRFRF